MYLSPTSASPEHSVKRFAQLMAALADPFAQRAAVLSAAGYDAESWDRLEREWSCRIAQDASGNLARAFGEVFAEPNAAPGATSDLDRTAEVPVHPMPSALPFGRVPREIESGFRRVPAARRIYEPPIRPARDPGDCTLEIPIVGERSPDLPFQRPMLVSRLHSFDSQTGAPLPEPLWVDDPVAANDPEKPV